MSVAQDSPAGLRRYQFTLARMVCWVIVAASVCFLVRNLALVVAAGLSLLPALLAWGMAGSLGLVGAMWRGFWDTLPARILLLIMFAIVVIPFSPMLLFCLNWERLAVRWPLAASARVDSERHNGHTSISNA